MIQRSRIADQLEQALFQNFKIHHPLIYCTNGHQLTNICTNPSCKQSSFCCQNHQCQEGRAHKHPYCCKVQLQIVTKLIQHRSNKKKEFFSNILAIQKDFYHMMQRQLMRVNNKISFNLSNRYQQVFKKIYIDKNRQTIYSREASKLYGFLTESKDEQREKYLMNLFERRSRLLLKDLIALKGEIFQIFLKEQSVENKLMRDTLPDSNILDQYLDGAGIETSMKNITAEMEKQKNINLIHSSVGNFRKMDLLFRASEHNYLASEFHRKCDNIPNTLTLIRTDQGRVIGAFTPIKWKSSFPPSQHPDPSGKSCIISFYDYKKMGLIKGAIAVVCDKLNGPIFGLKSSFWSRKSDLVIADNCRKVESCSDFPCSYDYSKSLRSNNLTNKVNQQFRIMRVVEYEVFRIIF